MRIHRTIYVTDPVIKFKRESGVTWEELLESAYESRNIERFVTQREYRDFAKRLSSFYMDEQLYNAICHESDSLRMTLTRYILLLLHDYVTHTDVSQIVSRETYEPEVQHGKK